MLAYCSRVDNWSVTHAVLQAAYPKSSTAKRIVIQSAADVSALLVIKPLCVCLLLVIQTITAGQTCSHAATYFTVIFHLWASGTKFTAMAPSLNHVLWLLCPPTPHLPTPQQRVHGRETWQTRTNNCEAILSVCLADILHQILHHTETKGGAFYTQQRKKMEVFIAEIERMIMSTAKRP